MTKAETKKLVRYLNEKFNEYRDIMNLNNWQIKIANQPKDLKSEDSKYAVTMQATISHEGYTAVSIDWGEGAEEMWEEKSWQEFERAIIHELSHVLTADLIGAAHDRYSTEGEIQQREERLCDNISVIIHRILNPVMDVEENKKIEAIKKAVVPIVWPVSTEKKK